MFTHPLTQGTLLLVMIATLYNAPALARPDPLQTAVLVEALRMAAPHTNDPALYSDWKMRTEAIARWTRRCIGTEVPPAEFAGNPVMVRETVACVIGPVLEEQMTLTGGDEGLAVRRATAWWMVGDPDQHQNTGGINTYVGRVLGYYWGLRTRR